MQRRVVDSAHTVPRPGPNLCAEWVARVYDNIGLGNVHMDAYE